MAKYLPMHTVEDIELGNNVDEVTFLNFVETYKADLKKWFRQIEKHFNLKCNSVTNLLNIKGNQFYDQCKKCFNSPEFISGAIKGTIEQVWQLFITTNPSFNWCTPVVKGISEYLGSVIYNRVSVAI